MNIFSHIYWEFVLLLRTVCSNNMPIYCLDYLFWCLLFWVLCRLWVLMGRTVGRFPPILEALFILIITAFAVQQIFNSMQSYLSSWGLFPVIQRSLVTICPKKYTYMPSGPFSFARPTPHQEAQEGLDIIPRATGFSTHTGLDWHWITSLPSLPDSHPNPHQQFVTNWGIGNTTV